MKENGKETMKEQEHIKEAIIARLERAGKPLAIEELIDGFEDGEAAVAVARALVAEGRLMLTRKQRFAIPEHMGLVAGHMHFSIGRRAFFVPDDGSEDRQVPSMDTHGAMHGDRVFVKAKSSQTGGVGTEVALITQRSSSAVVGAFHLDQKGRAGSIKPDESRVAGEILIPHGEFNGARDGDKVVVEITQYPDGTLPIMGKVREVLGEKDAKGVDMLSVVRRYDLPDRFSSAAMKQAEALNRPVDAAATGGREDLRRALVITIDGADARDLDDAVSLVRHGEGYTLGVHIADVSHYVRRGTALDREAYERGTSVYFPDRVLPMFPPDVSNGVCSLNPGADKLTLSCAMEFNRDGALTGYRIFESVIHTAFRMTYDSVNAIFSGDRAARERYGAIAPMLEDMRDLMELLNERRVKRGSIDFDIAEAKVILDENGIAIDVRKAERGLAERMIEEFMLSANETVARHAFDRGLPLMYRVHEVPDAEKMEELDAFLSTLGYPIRNPASVKPKTLQAIVLAAKGTKEEQLIAHVTLRSLKKARYAPNCLGHFGLASECYCHFTSPIRRYPDLTVHRLIKEQLHGALAKERVERLGSGLEEQSRHCSEREVVAAEAERMATDLKKAEYMHSQLGSIEDGIIVGLVQSGFFVQLNNTVEGMVRASSLSDDYYVLDEKRRCMVGRNKTHVFRLGDEVRVQVAAVDVENGNIDFVLVRTSDQGARRRNRENTAPKPKRPSGRTGVAKRRQR